METTTTEKVNTYELRTGDVVVDYGARILLGERTTFVSPTTGAGREVVHFRGEVLNADAPECHEWIAYRYRVDGSWAVQGNDLAIWHREI